MCVSTVVFCFSHKKKTKRKERLCLLKNKTPFTLFPVFSFCYTSRLDTRFSLLVPSHLSRRMQKRTQHKKRVLIMNKKRLDESTRKENFILADTRTSAR